MEKAEIKLVQKPIIEHQLKVIGENVTSRIAALELNTLVATEDSITTLKKTRAELNKEFSNWETQRKFVKKSLNDPYVEFETLYKSEISEKYANAESTLKTEITKFETKVKDGKLAEVKTYFDELCTSVKNDFLKWEHLGFEIKLSTSVKKYKAEVDAFVNKVQDDLALIATNEFHAEILVEYKASLNVAQAITIVQDRKQKELDEKAKFHCEAVARRVAQVKEIGMVYNDFSKSYAYNDKIVVTDQEIDQLDRGQWREMFADLDFQIKQAKADAQKEARAKELAESDGPVHQAAKPVNPVSAPVQQTIPEPEPATPEPQEDEKIVTSSFEVTATYSKLVALSEYMKANNIEYKPL